MSITKIRRKDERRVCLMAIGTTGLCSFGFGLIVGFLL